MLSGQHPEKDAQPTPRDPELPQVCRMGKEHTPPKPEALGISSPRTRNPRRRDGFPPSSQRRDPSGRAAPRNFDHDSPSWKLVSLDSAVPLAQKAHRVELLDSAECRRTDADADWTLREWRRFMPTEGKMGSEPKPQTVESARRRCVCAECVDVRYLEAEITRLGVEGKCSYCGKESGVIRIGDFAEYVKKLFDDHVEEVAEGAKVNGSRDFIKVISEQTSLKPEPANDLKIVFDDMKSRKHGNEGKPDRCFDKNTLYVYKNREELLKYNSWARLQECITEENRLFNGEAREILDDMLRGSLNLAISQGHAEIVRVVSNDSTQNLFRARVFRSDDDLEGAFGKPVQEFGPPPSSLAPDGRMNSRGVSVFYGATSRKCAIREVRPPVGSLVFVACFGFARDLRLIDATELKNIIEASMFNPSYIDLSKKLSFLLSLSEQISAPVMRSDEPLDYLITQAVSDYLSEMSNPQIDGIMYESTQKRGSEAENVVLFHKSSRVEMHKDQIGMKVKSEVGPEERVVYSLVEMTAEEKVQYAKEVDTGASDERAAALHLDMRKSSVHRIESVKYEDDESGIDGN